MFADLLATTPAGRTALAKALNYGQNANVFIHNKYIPLLSNGYSGKGVLYGHCERGLQFRVPSLRHISNPERIFTTNMNTFSNYQMSSYGVTYGVATGTTSLMNPHTYATSDLAVGYNLHAKLSDFPFGSVSDANYDLWNSNIFNTDGFVMGAGYNADVVSLEVMPGYNLGPAGDPDLITQFPSLRDNLDDIWVEVMEKAFYRGVQVAGLTMIIDNLNSDYIYYPENGDTTGIGNPISYINSLAADHNMVLCQASGNQANRFVNAVPTDNGGSGFMWGIADSRNVLTVGVKLIGGGTYSSINILGEDYARLKYYRNPAGDANLYTSYALQTAPSGLFTEEFITSYHGYGRTNDKAGPGQTNRVKPDIISNQSGVRQALLWPAITQADNTNNYLYTLFNSAATSGTAPSIAGGVCLLREALPLLDAHQIRECIMLSASNGNLTNSNTYNGLGYGLINLEAALAYGQARTHFLPPKLTAGNWLYSAGFQANVLAGASNTLSPFQPFTQFGVASNTFSPKSVQSFQCPRDDEIYTSNTAYTTAYNSYTTAYNTYVGRAASLWTAGVLDLSPARGLWGSSATRSFEAPTFDVVSTRSWISTSPEDLQEIKDLMVANGIKVCVTSNLLGAFSVDAESIEQLSAVVNGNTKIHGVFPVMTVQVHDNWSCE
jgi:hypothetical protein